MAQLLAERDPFVLGEDDDLDFTVTDENDANLSSATATVTITDATGATVLAATAMTGSGTTERRFVYTLTTGPAANLTAVGEYLATYIVTYGSRHIYYEQVIRVIASLALSTAWPDEDDIAERLQEAGIAVPARRILTRIRAAAIIRWQHLTRFYPFLSTGVDETRRFSPPESAVLPLKAGVLTLTSLTVHVYPGSSGTVLTVNEDFWLMPEDAAEKGQPYRWIQFRRWWHGLPRSMVIIGKWGYSLTVPDDAWEAVMSLAIAQVLKKISAPGVGGLMNIKLGQDSWTWNPSGPYAQDIKALLHEADQAAAYYRRFML